MERKQKEDKDRQADQCNMNDDLISLPYTRDQPVCIRVPASEEDLEEKHHRRPYRRRATKPRQNKLADHGLNLKEKECREKNADGKEKHECMDVNVARFDNFRVSAAVQLLTEPMVNLILL